MSIAKIKNLFTHHDPIHVHKILGFACLISFIYRFSHGFGNDMGMAPLLQTLKVASTDATTTPEAPAAAPDGDLASGDDLVVVPRVNYGTLVTILLHWFLSVSSLVFHIPTKRMEGAWRIWPEYRLHSILFATRNLALMTWTWVQDYYNIMYAFPKTQVSTAEGGQPLSTNLSSSSSILQQASQDEEVFMFKQTSSSLATFVPTVLIVLSTCWAADVATSYSPTTTTIRGLNAHPLVKYFFSVLQFTATAGCLIVGGNHTYSKHLMMVFVIQLNAFLMTLNRKNLIPQVYTVCAYLAMLIVGSTFASLVMLQDGNLFYLLAFAYTSAFVRIGLRMNKYSMWICMSCAMYSTYWTVEQGRLNQDVTTWNYPKQVAHLLLRQLSGEKDIVLGSSIADIWKPISCCAISTVVGWGMYTIYGGGGKQRGDCSKQTITVQKKKVL